MWGPTVRFGFNIYILAATIVARHTEQGCDKQPLSNISERKSVYVGGSMPNSKGFKGGEGEAGKAKTLQGLQEFEPPQSLTFCQASCLDLRADHDIMTRAGRGA